MDHRIHGGVPAGPPTHPCSNHVFWPEGRRQLLPGEWSLNHHTQRALLHQLQHTGIGPYRVEPRHFYEYKLEDELLGFQSEIMFANQGGNVEFSNYEKDFNYKMEFAYQYINIIGLAKWFPWAGKLSLGAGPFLGINVASRNIKYRSWGEGKEEAFGTDLQQEQQLKNVLRGKNNFGLALDAGYDINNVIKIGARYYWSATNTVETQANPYNFITAKNANTVWEFSIAVNFETLF